MGDGQSRKEAAGASMWFVFSSAKNEGCFARNLGATRERFNLSEDDDGDADEDR
jgi:hypothetical protein